MADRLAFFGTTKGLVIVKLDETATAGVVNNFIELAEKGFYNDLPFSVYEGKGPAITSKNANNTPDQPATALIFLYSDSTSLHFYIRLAAAPNLDGIDCQGVVLGGVASSPNIVNALGTEDRLLNVTITQ